METYPLPGGIQRFLRRAREIGVCVDFAFLWADSKIETEELHRQAALAGMREFDRRADEYRETLKVRLHGSEAKPDVPLTNKDFLDAKKYGITPQWPLGVNSLSFTLTLQPQQMESRKISVQEFLLPGSTLYASGPNGDYSEFRYAFLEPPYGLRPNETEAKLLYTTISDFLTSDHPEIRRWSDDWSNYFDEGKEWWGTFYWTIHNPTQGWIAAVGVSTTD